MRRFMLFVVLGLWVCSAAAQDPTQTNKTPSVVKKQDLLKITRSWASTWQDGTFRYQKATDGNIETSWGTGRIFEPKKDWITLYLEKPVFVYALKIATGLQLSGSSGSYMFKENGRPKSASVFFSDGTKQEITFQDKMGFQENPLRPIKTRWIKIQINTIYSGALNDPYNQYTGMTQDFGIAEIEVYGTELPAADVIED